MVLAVPIVSLPPEGMASRAVPVIRHWPGADTIYDRRWIGETVADLAAHITALDSDEAWRATGQIAHQQVQAFELGAVCRAWHRLIRGEPADGPAHELEDARGAGR